MSTFRKSRQTPVPLADRIPKVQKAAFSLGYCVDYLSTGLTVSVLWMPFFNIGLGMSPAILGGFLMLFRGWDAITDPIMGNITDNTRSRWGRRRPYIALGTVLTAISYILLWRVPAGLSPMQQNLMLGGLGILLFTCYTIWSMPFYSLMMELTPNYDERTRLSAWVAIAGKLIYLGGGWVLALATCQMFADPVTGKADIVRGMRAVSLLIAGLFLILGLLPAFFVKERYYKAASAGHRTKFWKSIRESIHCKPLWWLTGINFFLTLGMSITGILGQYVSIYYLNGGNLSSASVLNGWRSSGVMLIGILGIPLWTKLSEWLDKKIIVAIMLSCSMIGHLMNLFCLNPENPYLWLVASIFEAGAIGAVWLFLPAMKGDVADYDEIDTNTRREGSLNAFYSWFAKLAATIGAGLGGTVLQWSGFNAALGAQPLNILLRMKWLYIVLPIVLWSFTLLFIWRYSLDRKRMAAIRSQLEARRGAV
jgi:GPH family glycoside/pentoside/hexuronide:cation symporter